MIQTNMHIKRVLVSTLSYGEMDLTKEIVTPSIAAEWLERNVGNRRLRDNVAEQYARDMAEGNWHRKPLAVCFDEEGRLGNGQHTLTAIVRSGKPQELLVARGVPRLVIALMDRGCQRTITDVAHFVGEQFDKNRAAMSKVVSHGCEMLTGRQFSFSEVFAMYKDHREVIEFVLTSGSGRGRNNSIVAAVCARAAYTESRELIVKFLDILDSGIGPTDKELSAIRLRDVMASKAHNAGSTRRALYGKAQYALRSFLDQKPFHRSRGLHFVEGDIFPVPAT